MALTPQDSAKIQLMITQQATKIAQQVYEQEGSKYGVARTPLHRHNGQDSPTIGNGSINNFTALPATKGGVANPVVLGLETMNNPAQAGNPLLASQSSSNQVFVMPVPVIYGFGINLFSFASAPSTGATTGTLTNAWAYNSGVYRTLLGGDSEVRLVTFTNSSTSTSWTPGLASGGSTILEVFGSPFNFAGGDAPVGTILLFSNPQDSESNYAQLWVRLSASPNTPDQSLTLTGSVSVGAESATLTAPWGYETARYPTTFSTGEQILVQYTKGSTALTWITGLAESATSAITMTSLQWYGITNLSPLTPE